MLLAAAVVGSIMVNGSLDGAAAARPTPEPTDAPVQILTVTPTATPTVTPMLMSTPGWTLNHPLDAVEIQRLVIEFTNERRVERGFSPLVEDATISAIALSHSANMAKAGNLSHELNGEGPTERGTAGGYFCHYVSGNRIYYGLSENISEHPRVREWVRTGMSTEATKYYKDSEHMALALVAGWMYSPGHRKNIMDPDAKSIGVGIYIHRSTKWNSPYEVVWATQNFSSCSSNKHLSAK